MICHNHVYFVGLHCDFIDISYRRTQEALVTMHDVIARSHDRK